MGLTKSSKQHIDISEKELLALAGQVVNRYIRHKSIPQREKEDVQMAILEKFLNQKSKIIDRFAGGSKPTTYFIAILNRMCCEIIRKEMKNWTLSESNTSIFAKSETLSPAQQLIIADEIKLLDDILKLFFEEMPKVKLFLAFYYGLIINEIDIQNYDADYKTNNLVEIFASKEFRSKSECFDCISQAVNIVEQKQTKSDTNRIWLNKIIDKIILRLNGSFNRANYDKESLQILFELYYSKENTGKHNTTQTQILTLITTPSWILSI